MKKVAGKILILFIGLMFLCAFAATAGATLLTWTDDGTYLPSGGVGVNPITYSLEFDFDISLSGFSWYGATLTVSNWADIGPEEWYAGWFLFKFDTNVKGEIENLVSPAGTGPWDVADSDENPTVSVLQGGTYNTLLHNGFSGFYLTSLASGSPDATQGVLLTGDSDPFVFTFDIVLPDGKSINELEMPFQVGFYGDTLSSGNIHFGQLSRDLSVPEPATVLLLGAGFLGLALLRRRRARTKA